MQHRLLRAEAGFTLIEVLVAAVVLVIGVLGSMMVFDRANRVTVDTRAREGATNLTRELTEAARGVQYDQIAPSALPSILAGQPGLEDAVPATTTYEIERRGVTYAVTLASCIVDDPRDGGGNQATGGFCPGSATPNTPPASTPTGSADRNPEDYKQVTATVAWTVRGVSRTATQEVIVNNPGSSAGPSVRTISLVGFATTQPVIVTDSPVRLLFETSYRPATTNWTLDAAVQSPRPAQGAHTREYFVDWNHSGLVDGTYVLGAEAYDRYGVAGPGKSLSVLLNRHRPAAPQGLVGGRNGATLVELAWRANVEKDIVGYTVERCAGTCASPGDWLTLGTGTPENRTSWQDTDPPSAEADAPPVAYRVRAWDRGSDGQPATHPVDSVSAVLRLPAENLAPADPVAPRLTYGAGGVATVRWGRPADDPDDPIIFYRVYRGGDGIRSRYATVDSAATAAAVEFTDAETGGMQHKYWISAVDRWFQESGKVEATVEGAP